MEEAADLKVTPLVQVHEGLGARMVPFAGWRMPVQYTSVLAEHRAVRSHAGLFDLSHMGELWLTGPDALANLQNLTSNDASSLPDGRAQYTLLLNERGGVIDDILIYRLAADRFLLVVNAANIDKDAAWIESHLTGNVQLTDRSPQTALLAVQGPHAQAILQRLTDLALPELRPFRFIEGRIAERNALISRTGYTGEDGFELYIDAADAPTLWDALSRAGGADGLVPVGLGARDTLRLEARLCLYGNELTEEVTPLEAGLDPFVKLQKGDFIGREALVKQQAEGVTRRLVGFVMEERGIPRHGYGITVDGQLVGQVTSGSLAPSLEREIGLGYVSTAYTAPDTPIWIDIRGKPRRAKVVAGRFISSTTS